MNKVIIEEIKNRMKEDLLPEQIIKLGKVLEEVLNIDNQQKNKDLIKLFIFTKKSEGRSARTETYYTQVLRTFENEDYIIKSPMRRIRKVKIPNTIKSVFTDENIVKKLLSLG